MQSCAGVCVLEPDGKSSWASVLHKLVFMFEFFKVSFFFFLMWTIFLKSLSNLLQFYFCFMFWVFFCFFVFFFGYKACGIIVPQPAIKLVYPALEGEIFNTGLPGRAPQTCYLSGSHRFVMVLSPSLAVELKTRLYNSSLTWFSRRLGPGLVTSASSTSLPTPFQSSFHDSPSQSLQWLLHDPLSTSPEWCPSSVRIMPFPTLLKTDMGCFLLPLEFLSLSVSVEE